MWQVLPIVQSNTTNAHSIHIQAEWISQKGNLINNSNNGVAWPGLVHCHLNTGSFHGFRDVTAALETKGPPIDNRWLWTDFRQFVTDGLIPNLLCYTKSGYLLLLIHVCDDLRQQIWSSDRCWS
jgi:hypothetical protein